MVSTSSLSTTWRLLICALLFVLASASGSVSTCRQTCGYEGISRAECEGRGCCFDAADAAEHRCFQKVDAESCAASASLPLCRPDKVRKKCEDASGEFPCDAGNETGKDAASSESSRKHVMRDSDTQETYMVVHGKESYGELVLDEEPTVAKTYTYEEVKPGDETQIFIEMQQEEGLRYIPKGNEPASQSVNRTIVADAPASEADEESASELRTVDELTESDEEASTSHVGTEDADTQAWDMDATSGSEVDPKAESGEEAAATQHPSTKSSSDGELQEDSHHVESHEVDPGSTEEARYVTVVHTHHGEEGFEELPEEEELTEEKTSEDVEDRPSETRAAFPLLKISRAASKIAESITKSGDLGVTHTTNSTTSFTTDTPIDLTTAVPETMMTHRKTESPLSTRGEQTTFETKRPVTETGHTSGLRSTRDPAAGSGGRHSHGYTRHARSRKERAGRHAGDTEDQFSFHIDFSIDASGTQKTSKLKHKKHHHKEKRHNTPDEAECRVYTLEPCGTEFLNEEECKSEGCCWLKINRNFIEGCYKPSSRLPIVIS